MNNSKIFFLFFIVLMFGAMVTGCTWNQDDCDGPSCEKLPSPMPQIDPPIDDDSDNLDDNIDKLFEENPNIKPPGMN